MPSTFAPSGTRASRRPDAVAQLSAELEAAALRAAVEEYDQLNWALFANQLHRPLLEFSAGDASLGSWNAESRVIQLSRSLLFGGWGVLSEVLKHEMAHQYVHEVLGVRDQTAHGGEFREVCASRGIDARAAGAPEPSGAARSVLERIAKLLALAESPNEHEAQAAMRAAQRLLTRHNLDTASALRQHGLGFVHLGVPTARVREPARLVGQILTEHFFVHTIWTHVWRPLEGKPGRVLEICGREPNLRIAEYVHDFLHYTAEELWRAHKRAHGIRRDRDRLAYLAGVMTGFLRRLGEERRQQAESGLVPKRDSGANGYFRRRYPRQANVRYRSTAGSAAHAAGHAAGRRLVLRHGLTSSSSQASGLALPEGRPRSRP